MYTPDHPFEMALEKIPFSITQVHPISLTISPHVAVGARPRFHPGMVTVGLELVFPYFQEVIMIDVALGVVGTDTCASRYASVGEDARHGDTRMAKEGVWPHVEFILPHETLTAVVDRYLWTVPLRIEDKVEQVVVMLIREDHLRVGGRPSKREDIDQSPVLHTMGDQPIAELGQRTDIALRSTRHHIPHHKRLVPQQTDSLFDHAEAPLTAPHPIVVRLQTVKAHRHSMQPSVHQPAEALGGEVEGIGHDTPRETHFVDSPPTLLQILSHQRFTPTDGDEDLMRIVFPADTSKHTKKILHRHVGGLCFRLAVAATMPATEVTSERTLPKHLRKRMPSDNVAMEFPFDLQCNLLGQRQPFVSHRRCFIWTFSDL